jgi:hypothetical protein
MRPAGPAPTTIALPARDDDRSDSTEALSLRDERTSAGLLDTTYSGRPAHDNLGAANPGAPQPPNAPWRLAFREVNSITAIPLRKSYHDLTIITFNPK